jgi:hypothetical protein
MVRNEEVMHDIYKTPSGECQIWNELTDREDELDGTFIARSVLVQPYLVAKGDEPDPDATCRVDCRTCLLAQTWIPILHEAETFRKLRTRDE